jgi:hypothetical protein
MGIIHSGSLAKSKVVKPRNIEIDDILQFKKKSAEFGDFPCKTGITTFS